MILRIGVCIPTYNNPTTIATVVRDCLAQCQFPILVVDDGSERAVTSVLTDPTIVAALNSGRVEVLRHETNQGKGVAIRTAVARGLALGLTHLVTIDGDGQHLASEISKLVSITQEDPFAVVIGSREFRGENIPRSTRFGRAFSNFWVKRESSAVVQDSQSGFRIYPLFHLQSVTFRCRHYDFEIEVLIRLAWRGVTIRETPIQVYYPPPAERVSHFHKFRDNVRISLLNTLLFAISLFRLHLSPAQASLALGIGVFVGCTPFFGFHTFIVGLIAVLFPLNAGMLWLGSQVSIPPLAPFLAVASIKVGNQMGGTSGLKLGAWLRGSVIVGSVLGVGVGAAAFAVALLLRQRARRERRNWTGKSRGGKFGNWFLGQVVKRGGPEAGYLCLIFIVPYFYLFAPKATRASLEYWRRLEPESGFFLLRWRVLRHYYRFGTVLLDRVYQSHFDLPQFVSSQVGFENIPNTLREGKGVILLSAHVGAWDIAARYMKRAGLRESFHPVQYDPSSSVANPTREEPHLRTLFTNQGAHPILAIHQTLREGKPIGMMGDRPVDRHYELLPFLGGLAAFDTTPFRVAATAGVPLLFTFGFKASGRQYDFVGTTPKEYRYAADREREVQLFDWALEFASTLERVVRDHRDQWFNFYPFWSSPPSLPRAALRRAALHPLAFPSTPGLRANWISSLSSYFSVPSKTE